MCALTELDLFFPVACFIHVFDQTLAEQLYTILDTQTYMDIVNPIWNQLKF